VHNVSQWQLVELLGEPKACWKQWVLRRRRKVWVEKALWMPDGSEFQTAGAATLKPREVEVVRTWGADNRLVFPQRRQRVGVW